MKKIIYIKKATDTELNMIPMPIFDCGKFQDILNHMRNKGIIKITIEEDIV